MAVNIKSVTFIKKYRCFNIGDTFNFRPGVNLLVGDQGTGKSTLISSIRESSNIDNIEIVTDRYEIKSFNFEFDSPRGKSRFDDKKDFKAQLVSIMCSHGEFVNGLLNSLGNEKDITFILDEPDTALSVRSCFKLVQKLKMAEKNNCQIIAAVHSPIIICAFDEVLSLEHKRWIKSKDFLNDHGLK